MTSPLREGSKINLLKKGFQKIDKNKPFKKRFPKNR